jgi:cytidine deaminase
MSSDDRKLRDLISAATVARANAYAPYSGFSVGAALLGVGGGIYAGANVENAAYPQSQCAEASALGLMISEGERRLEAVLVIAAGPSLVTPCGGCRQRLFEFGTAETPVHLCSEQGLVRTISLGDLLPLGFGPSSLGR